MSRKACLADPIRFVGGLVLMALVAGCGGPGPGTVETVPLEEDLGGEVWIEHGPTQRQISMEDLARMDQKQFNEFVAHHVELLGTLEWEYAQERLREVGLEALPFLIAALDRDDSAATLLRPAHAVSDYTESRFYTLGDMALLVLNDLIINYSNVEVTPEQPLPGHNRAAWEAWYDEHQGDLIVAGRSEPLHPVESSQAVQ